MNCIIFIDSSKCTHVNCMNCSIKTHTSIKNHTRLIILVPVLLCDNKETQGKCVWFCWLQACRSDWRPSLPPYAPWRPTTPASGARSATSLTSMEQPSAMPRNRSAGLTLMAKIILTALIDSIVRQHEEMSCALDADHCSDPWDVRSQQRPFGEIQEGSCTAKEVPRTTGRAQR